MDRPNASRALRAWLRPRVRLFGTALLVGVGIGALTLRGYALVEPVRAARATVFSVGALALGVATLGWSGSVLAGRGIENMQRHLDTGSDWTERDSRRAMTRVAGFGLGVMVGASLA